MGAPRGLLANVVKAHGQREGDDQADDQGNGDGQAARRRRRRAPSPKRAGAGISRSRTPIFRRLELEAVERGEDKSKIVVAILDRHLPHFSLTKMDRPPESD